MKNVVLTLIFLFCVSALFAQKNKLKDLEKQRLQAQLDIENTDRLLKDTQINTASLLNRIKLLSSQIESRQKIVTLLEQEVEQIVLEENEIAAEVKALEGELLIKKDAYHKAIVSMMRNRQGDNNLLFVLSGGSLGESYRRFKYLQDYSEWRKRQAGEIQSRNDLLGLKQDSLQLAKVEKEGLLSVRANEQQKLKEEELNFQEEVDKAKKNQKDLQRILDQKKRQAQALDRQIEKLIAEEVARQEAKAAQELASTGGEKPKETTDTPWKGTATKPAVAVVSTQENVKLSNNFASNKGRLPFPISGDYTITSRFGPQKHGRWVTTSSGGIDIQSQASAQAKAVFTGEITYISSFPGYGTCVIIRHGNYYTFYGNIQTVTVKKGDKVSTGQTLGTVYTDPNTNISQMHFQLWQSRTKLNPEPWLRR